MSREALAEQIMSRALPLPQGSGDGQMERVIREGVQKGLTKLAQTSEGKLALFNLALWKGDGFGKAFDEAITDWVVWSTPDSPTQGSDQLADALYTTLVDYFQNKLGSDEAAPKLELTDMGQHDYGKVQDSDIGDKARHVGKSIILGGRHTGFNGLTKTMQQSFKEGLKSASPEVQLLLRKWKRKAQYTIAITRRSYHSPDTRVITIGRNAIPSTIAHELFHWMDEGKGISKRLSEALMQDQIALTVAGGEDIKAYLVKKYPGAFRTRPVSKNIVMRPEYRGIADILNGMSGGEVHYGYGHSSEYWKKSWALEVEAWAQFGRHQYENIPEVLKMFQELLPNFYKSAILKLKELM